MPIAYISHNDCLSHDVGEDHPEQPDRLHAIQDRLIYSPLNYVIQHHDAPLATREDLERVHSREYVDEIFEKAPQEGIVYLDDDTFMMPKTLNAALRAAGAALYAVDQVMGNSVKSAFCAARPPGHHAERDRAMGFCYFNNIAVGAAYAMEKYGLERIAIIDFDVHHGNGTEDIFKDDPRVLFCSSFQHPFYPFSGADTERENVINIPMTAGTSGEMYRKEVEEKWFDQIEAFEPQLIMLSAGFDGHAEDDMAHFRLRESDYRWLTERLAQIAAKTAQGRIVSVLEGGYSMSALGRSVIVHLDALL